MVVRDHDGNPVIGEDGKPLLVSEPDTRAAAKFMDMAAKLDALNEENNFDSKGNLDLVTLMNMASLAAAKKRELEAN